MEILSNQCVNCCELLGPGQRRAFFDSETSRYLSEVNGCNFQDFLTWLNFAKTFICKNCYSKAERLVNARARIAKLEEELKNEANLEQNLFQKFLAEIQHRSEGREIQLPDCAPLRKRQRLQSDVGENTKGPSSKEVGAKKTTKRVSLLYLFMLSCPANLFQNSSSFIFDAK